MPVFTPLDERFIHQIPEPFPNTVLHHHDWRESLYFVMHPRDRLGDVQILTLAQFPVRQIMDSYQGGRIGAENTMILHKRPLANDQDDFFVGPVTIDIEEPLQRVRLRVAEDPSAPVSLDITFTARTQPYCFRRGMMKAGDEVVWDQTQMIQSGRYDGWYRRNGVTYEVNDWVGQRDHSWGIRAPDRVPCWIWLAVQLPEGMFGCWHWEYPNGAIVFSDGCFAPADGSSPIPMIRFEHDLTWTDATGAATSYERNGEHVAGLAGRVAFTLEGGKRIELEAKGRWAQRYSSPELFALIGQQENPHGGGVCEMLVTSSEGSTGTAIYEVTGQWHHKYFPLPRGHKFPPNGHSPAAEERAV